MRSSAPKRESLARADTEHQEALEALNIRYLSFQMIPYL